MINIKIEHRCTGKDNLDYNYTAHSRLYIAAENEGDYFEYDGSNPVSLTYTSYIQNGISPRISMNGDFIPSRGVIYDTNDDEEYNITINVNYDPPSSGGNNPDTGEDDTTDDTPMVVTFNYYIDGEFIDDEKLEAIGWGGSEPVEERWPRTLECYHIRFDKINPSGDSTAGTGYNSLEFTYIDLPEFDENDLVNDWPYTGTLDEHKKINAFTHRYFVEENCVTINGIGYNGGEDFTETPKPIFHSNNTKTLEVNLYYISDKVSINVHSYNVDDEKYSDYDLWGYVSAQMGGVPSNNFTTTNVEYKYPVPLTMGYSMYCRAIAKPGFEFGKWVSTSEVNSIHSDTETYNSETARRNAVLALPAIESLDDSLPDDEIQISAYSSKDITAVFKSVKHKVKLYRGLDFSGTDIYYIYSGSKRWLDNEGTYIFNITIPEKEGATLLGWVDYDQNDDDPDTKEYPYITRSEYNAILLEHNFDNLYEDIFNFICDSRERIISGVIRIDVKDGTKVPILISKNDGYTDSYGNWLTGDKTLYPLWLLEEYDINYVSDGGNSLFVDESGMVDGKLYKLNPSDFGLPETYNITDDITFEILDEKPDVEFPQYHIFDKWVPSEIKPFTKTGEQTITAHWILDTDTYKITLEKNNGYWDQSVRIKVGESKFVNEEKINNPSIRTAYKSFEGWYTENDINTENGTGQLIIDKEGNLQKNVSGYTNSEGQWIRNEDTTVYAKWTPEEYKIRYYIYYNEEYEVIIHNYTIEDTKPTGYNLLSDSFGDFTPEGHFLDGWYTNEDYSGSQISILERGTTGDKTFYGMFKPQEYTIAYNNIDSCTNIEALPVKHTYGSETILIDPEVPQYKFLGWYTDEQFTNQITSIPANYPNQVGGAFFGYIYLYAKLVLEQIPILYKDSNGNVIDDSQFNDTPPKKHTYGLTTPLVNAYKDGYTFDGWYDSIECSGEKLTVLEGEDYLTDIVLYCKFTPIAIEKTIKYYIDGVETTDTGNPSTFTEEDLPIQLENPSDKLGYHSIGWRRNSSSSTTVVNQITYLDDWKLYWVWEPNVVTITWNANGGTVSPPSNQYTYDGDSVELPIPTKTGYEFAGWYTSTSGGTKITDIGVNNKPTEDITYYAYWTEDIEVKYTVKHYKQALDGTYPDNLCVTEEYYGTTSDSVTPDVKEDYIGFTKPQTITVQISADGSTVVEYEYTRNKYNITWDVNGGETLTGDYTNGSVYFEIPIIKPNNPIKEGYVFSGWSPSIPETMPANDIVFTASYIEEKTNLVSEIIDTELETVTVGKIATDKWINNVIGEPEKTNFEHLGNFFNTTFGNNITGECVTGNDLENFFSTELNKCIKQSQFIEIFSKSENVSNGYIVEKNFTFSISSNNESNLEFTVTIPESEESIPNYPNTTGFIMYYTLGNNSTLYKTSIPINKSCNFSLENISDSIVIHRIPLYYSDSMNACILPKITIQNNTNRIVGDTLITSQIE